MMFCDYKNQDINTQGKMGNKSRNNTEISMRKEGSNKIRAHRQKYAALSGCRARGVPKTPKQPEDDATQQIHNKQ